MEDKKFQEPIFKHYFKAKDFGGFLSVIPFDMGEKFNIQIGQTDAQNKLKQFTSVYAEFVLLATYLRSVSRDTVAHVFSTPKEQATLTVYGGGNVDGNEVSRVLKVTPEKQPYQLGDGFWWKCGYFKGKKTATGAYIPDMSSPIQQDRIKISRQTMEEISYIIDNYILKHDLKKSTND